MGQDEMMQRQSFTTSHQHTEAQPVSKPQLPWRNSPSLTAPNSLLSLLLTIFHMARTTSLASQGQLSWLCPFPTSFPPHSLLGAVAELKKREGLGAVRVLFSNS